MTSDERADSDQGAYFGRIWAARAQENEGEWGIQHPEELLSAITEEVGEIDQAYLEATHEGDYRERVKDEIHDLGPLLFQLHRSVNTHPMAFEPLPTASEVRDNE